MSQKLALIIGNSEYEDPNLTRLVTPNADVNALVEVLRDPEISHFGEVTPLINQPADTIRRAIARFFAKKTREDLLLLYFSGHGVLDDQGHLYLAVKDTENDLLSGTAIPAAFITSQMDRSRSQRQVLILDCCHSGAFARGSKGMPGASVGTATTFEGTGYGRVVLTASDSTQYAWEGDQVIGDAENSVFTHYLIQGLRTGEADTDADGQITIGELYNYVYEHVVNQTSKQKPGKWSYKEQGEIVIARNPHPVVKPAELPQELQQSLESPLKWVREGAVQELDRLLRGSNKGLALAAHEALKQMVDDDSRRVSEAAADILAVYDKAQSTRADPETETERLATEKTEPEQPEPETEIEKEGFEPLEGEEKIRPEPKIAEITREKREIRKDKRTKRVSLRTKMLLLAGVSVLLVAGVILFISVIKPMPTIRLRSEPLTVSEDEVKKVFGLDETGRPLKYIQNDFEDQGKVVIDHATGLMWQKSGSSEGLPYKEVQAYIDQLNREGFADYDDWRLPTVEELMSLLEPETPSNDLYINPIFDKKQYWCWSADQSSSESAWNVSFDRGDVGWDFLDDRYYVRAVRS